MPNLREETMQEVNVQMNEDLYYQEIAAKMKIAGLAMDGINVMIINLANKIAENKFSLHLKGIVEEIEKIKDPTDYPEYYLGYNQALQDAIQIIQQHIKS
jgi:hypothetical protein